MTKNTKNPTKFEQTHIEMVLDRSGSMSTCRIETITAVNQYLADARKDANLKEADFGLSIFDSQSIDQIRDGAPVKITDISEEDFVPRGWTPLYDAVGRGIDRLDGKLKASGSTKAILVVVTDGAENASKKYTHGAITELIAARQGAGWMVIFLGAGLAAAQQGVSLGVRAGYMANIGTSEANLGATMGNLRSMNAKYAATAGGAATMDFMDSGEAEFSAEQRKDMGDASAGAGLIDKKYTDGMSPKNQAARAGKIDEYRAKIRGEMKKDDNWAKDPEDAWKN